MEDQTRHFEMESDSEEYWSAASVFEGDENEITAPHSTESKEPLGWMPDGTPIPNDETFKGPIHGMRYNMRMWPWPFSPGESETGSDGPEAPQIVDLTPNKRYYPPEKRRPLAEPPILDYDDFVENTLPSDLRFSKLFPNNLEKWVDYRDTVTERLLHDEYRHFAFDMSEMEEDPARIEFYTRLHGYLYTDKNSLGFKNVNMDGYSELGRWEYAHLDQDGCTENIESWSTRQWRTSLLSKEAWLKYGHLAPEGFKPARFWSGPTGQDSRPASPTDVVGLRPRLPAAAHCKDTVLDVGEVQVGKRKMTDTGDEGRAQKKRHI